LSLLQINLSGVAGLAVGLLAVAVAAEGYAHNDFLAAVCTALGVGTWLAYIGMALDRYDRARRGY